MNAPSVARRLFDRLCKGDNLLLSRNGPDDDPQLFQQVELEEKDCIDYFGVLGLRLERGDGCFFFAAEDDPQATAEAKLDRIIRLVRLLDFLTTHVENFGEGQHFSATTLAARCQGDARAERLLQEVVKGATYADRVEALLQSLVTRGYLSEVDPARKEYRVLSAIHYLFSFADRIEIHGEEDDTVPAADAQA